MDKQLEQELLEKLAQEKNLIKQLTHDDVDLDDEVYKGCGLIANTTNVPLERISLQTQIRGAKARVQELTVNEVIRLRQQASFSGATQS